MPELSLRHYKAVALIAELRSFTLASKQLFISVAALSKIIREAEDMLGFAVFERSPKAVSITHYGSIFLPFAKDVVSAHEISTDNARLILQNRLGSVRVAGTELVNAAFLFRAVDIYLLDNPGVEISVFESKAETLQEELQRGAFDLVVGPKRVVEQNIQCVDVCEVPLYFVSPKGSYSDRKTMAWHEIVGKPLIFLDSRAVLHVTSYLDNRFTLTDWRVLNSASTALASVENGRGFMISSAYTQKLARAFEVDFIRIVGPEVRMPVTIYHHARQPQKNLIRDVAAGLTPLVRSLLVDLADILR